MVCRFQSCYLCVVSSLSFALHVSTSCKHAFVSLIDYLRLYVVDYIIREVCWLCFGKCGFFVDVFANLLIVCIVRCFFVCQWIIPVSLTLLSTHRCIHFCFFLECVTNVADLLSIPIFAFASVFVMWAVIGLCDAPVYVNFDNRTILSQ